MMMITRCGKRSTMTTSVTTRWCSRRHSGSSWRTGLSGSCRRRVLAISSSSVSAQGASLQSCSCISEPAFWRPSGSCRGGSFWSTRCAYAPIGTCPGKRASIGTCPWKRDSKNADWWGCMCRRSKRSCCPTGIDLFAGIWWRKSARNRDLRRWQECSCIVIISTISQSCLVHTSEYSYVHKQRLLYKCQVRRLYLCRM